ncbi:uncharacterized protein DEA37_0009193 [Paragonimus westermani]|uniref:Secreted protein n=1 Tax=Paragonimus westermani TaxID=34504 RepID=A0A5J4NQ24_9TREM|nr:uncharacterized protein DEA37_0009193 [Paragonimus westermani]
MFVWFAFSLFAAIRNAVGTCSPQIPHLSHQGKKRTLSDVFSVNYSPPVDLRVSPFLLRFSPMDRNFLARKAYYPRFASSKKQLCAWNSTAFASPV